MPAPPLSPHVSSTVYSKIIIPSRLTVITTSHTPPHSKQKTEGEVSQRESTETGVVISHYSLEYLPHDVLILEVVNAILNTNLTKYSQTNWALIFVHLPHFS